MDGDVKANATPSRDLVSRAKPLGEGDCRKNYEYDQRVLERSHFATAATTVTQNMRLSAWMHLDPPRSIRVATLYYTVE